MAASVLPTAGRGAAPLVSALLLVSLAFVLLRSPTAHPTMAWSADVALAFATLAVLAGRRPRRRTAGGLVAALGLLALSHLMAAERAASWDVLAQWCRLGLAFAAAHSLGAAARARWEAAGAACIAAAAAAAHASWQLLWGHPELLRAGSSLPAAVVGQLADRRANSVFLLPAHLGAFLAMVLPLAVLLLVAGASRRWRALGAVGLAASAAGLAVAGSVGGCLLAGGAVAAVCLLGLTRRRAAVVLVLALALTAGLVALSTSRRADEIGRENPGGARLVNWTTAALLVRERPWWGWGGGGFAIGAPRLRPPEANEAVHAHQALLEVAVDHGLPAALLLTASLALLVARIAGQSLRARRRGDTGRVLAAAWAGAAAAALGHGLIDFGWSDPGWGVGAAAVLGIASAGHPGRSPRRAPAWCAAIAAAAPVAILVGSSIVTSAAASHREVARSALHGRRPADALAAVHRGLLWQPDEPRLLVIGATAEMALAFVDREAAAGHRARAVALAERAVAASPERAVVRARMALALRSAGRREDALREAERAVALAPGVASHRRLRDRLRARLAQPGPD